MKKSTRKTVNYLSRYIGLPIIRTNPTALSNDWSFTSKAILLTGFTKDGRIQYRYLGTEAKVFGDKEKILSLHFTDRNWITLKKASRAKQNKLNDWRGEKIYRVKPTEPRSIEPPFEMGDVWQPRYGNCFNEDFASIPRGDHSFMLKFITSTTVPILISASKYHIILSGRTKDSVRILSKDYAKPEDWALYNSR